MNYLRKVDLGVVAAAPAEERVTQVLLDHDSGATSCAVNWIRTPPGGGSPAGMHVHAVDQLFYVLSGIMSLEIEGQAYEAGPGTLVIFPSGVPHRNWNAGTEPTVHLAINVPLPDPHVPFSRPAASSA
ncbi:MAG: cupin domain-containing protein [Chloroflexota bacterium]|nr:cupin domain-containing protein [Chloroflexota bacterium]